MRACRWAKIFTLLLTGVPATVRSATICNAGFPGENSAQVLRHLPEAFAGCPHARFVVLFVGMNDAVNDKQFLTPELTFASVTQMLKDVAAVPAQAIVVTVHMPDVARLLQRHAPETYGSKNPAQRILQTNEALRRSADQQGARLVDFNDVIAKAGGANKELSTDGVHLTRKGYHLLAVAVASALPHDASAGTVLCLGDSLTYGIGVRAADTPDEGSESYPQQLSRLLKSLP